MKHLETGATNLVPERKSARNSFAVKVYDRNCPSVWSQLPNFIFRRQFRHFSPKCNCTKML